MKTSLRQQSKNLFEQQKLDDTALQSMQTLQQQLPQQSQQQKQKHRSLNWGGRYQLMASLCVVIAVFALWFIPQQPAVKNQADLIAAIANEVAKNHIRMKPLDIESQQFNDIQQFFTQLEFMPTPSVYFQTQQHSLAQSLIGGRYCSIQSITAAQLRFGDKEKTHTTLYQTEYLPEVFGQLPVLEQGQTPVVTYAKGLRIEIWVEKQLLMVTSQLVSNPS